MLVVLVLISLAIFVKMLPDKDSFSIGVLSIEPKIKVGESLRNSIAIKNIGESGNFEAGLSGLDGLAEISESNFYLESGDSKHIELFFEDSKLIPGSYVGYLRIKNQFDERKIPIILSIDSENTLFAINLDVAPANQEISKGEATKTNLKFFSLIDTKPHTVLVNYEIRNLEGKSVVSEQNEIIVTLTSSITEIINLPEKIDSGEYVFTAILTSEESLTSASYVFSVDAGKKTDLFFSIWTLLFFILVFVIIVFVLIGYMFYERNKLFSKLKNQQVHQISFYSNQINKQQKKSLAGAKTEKERQKILAEFKEGKEKILDEIRNEQIKQKKEFEKIRREKGNGAVEKKIGYWKKNIYPRAIKRAEISQELKVKLGVLKRAYDEGYISKESYAKGKERINTAKRNVYK